MKVRDAVGSSSHFVNSAADQSNPVEPASSLDSVGDFSWGPRPLRAGWYPDPSGKYELRYFNASNRWERLCEDASGSRVVDDDTSQDDGGEFGSHLHLGGALGASSHLGYSGSLRKSPLLRVPNWTSLVVAGSVVALALGVLGVVLAVSQRAPDGPPSSPANRGPAVAPQAARVAVDIVCEARQSGLVDESLGPFWIVKYTTLWSDGTQSTRTSSAGFQWSAPC